MSQVPSSPAAAGERGGVKQILRSYFYWTYPRGSLHYDVMVTLILLFIFITPHLWNFGAKPWPVTGTTHPILVSGYGTHGLVVTVDAADVKISAGATDREVKRALKHTIEPVTGDEVVVDRWQTATGAQGNLVWQVWAHR